MSGAPRTEEATIALNPARVGHVYPAYRYEVTREKLREYARATGVADPQYEADPADVPLAELVAPPTFAACFCVGRMDVVLGDPELGAHDNLVHGSQEFTFHRPVRGGDVLECTPRIVDLTDRGRMALLTFEIDCADWQTQAPVVTARSVIIFFAEERA